MRIRRPIVYLLVSLSVLVLAGAAHAQTPRILLVGDSWVDQAWSARAFQTALQNKGLGQFEEVGGATTIGGSTAAQWATAPYLALITNALAANPSVDIVHLSIGGNDFLGAPPGTDLITLATQILNDIATVVAHIQSVRPGIRIAQSTYDYLPGGTFNTESAALSQLMINQAAGIPDYFILDQLGVLQHVFGYPPNFAAGAVPLPGGYPGYTPLAGGDPAFGSDPALFDDAIHPSDPGYVALAEHGIDEFYEVWLLGAAPVPGLGGAGLGVLAAVLAGSGSRGARALRAA